VGDLLSGEVQQIERGKLVVMLNKFREAEAIIPYREQNHREHYHQGEPVRAVLKRVEDTPKGPRLILSRSGRLFVQALFKLEVPEIQQHIVEIKAAAREVGSRTKIAVTSRDEAVDPVGACVGLKGARVQAVVNELGGERIDIVPWSPDPERFAKLALAPARVARVFSDALSRTIQAVVDEDQLSLAIGRNGQNVRLASELTGWKIDLYSSREWLEKGGEACRCSRRSPRTMPRRMCRSERNRGAGDRPRSRCWRKRATAPSTTFSISIATTSCACRALPRRGRSHHGDHRRVDDRG
jgi:transcription termination/antitermination protein NusA